MKTMNKYNKENLDKVQTCSRERYIEVVERKDTHKKGTSRMEKALS
jgi:hypothetical protein